MTTATRASEIIDKVCEYFGRDKSLILKPSRRKSSSTVRWVCMVLLRESGCTLEEIGELLRRDHTTIIHGLTSIKKRMAYDAELEKQVYYLRKDLFPALQFPCDMAIDMVE